MIQLGLKINKFSVVLRTVLRGSAIIVLFLAIPLSVQGAILYLEPNTGQYQPGDTFIVEVKIDTEDECINAIEANLNFSQDILRAVDFSQGQSIITLWIKTPSTANIDAINREGLISFSGGIPGGYCGRIPGDPGPSNLLGKIIFRIPGMMVREPGKILAEVKFLDTSQVLLNDGLGTQAKLISQGATFEIREAPQMLTPSTAKDEWQEELRKDGIPPESFEIEIHQGPAIFEGKYFITFSTTDKQTGLDYYEVKEGERDWEIGESPYLLEDQTLKSIIKVRAVDKAGNERIAEYIPEIPKKPFPYWAIIIIVIGLVVIWWVLRKSNIKYQKSKIHIKNKI